VRLEEPLEEGVEVAVAVAVEVAVAVAVVPAAVLLVVGRGPCCPVAAVAVPLHSACSPPSITAQAARPCVCCWPMLTALQRLSNGSPTAINGPPNGSLSFNGSLAYLLGVLLADAQRHAGGRLRREHDREPLESR
jgi:hypothetical protein